MAPWTEEALAKSQELADHLGAEARALIPEAPTLGIAPDLASGILEEDEVPSSSGSHLYRLVRTAGGWQHADTTCRGWLFRGTCRHVEEKNKMESTALVATNTNVLAIIDEIEDSEVAKGIRSELTEVWAYEFPMGGKSVVGVSSKGVENGCRELAKKGEAIREMDVKLEYEDDNEARFVAQAGRYAVNAEGRDVLLDAAIRAKRQSKWEKRRDGSVVFDDNWYEKGVTKAARNAKLALMPDSIVALIIAEAKKQGRTRQVKSPSLPQRRQVAEPRPVNVDQDGVINDVEPEITTATKNAIAEAYHKVRGARGEEFMTQVRPAMQDRWAHAFLNNSNRLTALSEPEGYAVLEFLEGEMPPPSDEPEPPEAMPVTIAPDAEQGALT